jgi:hypothetical protein
MRCHVWEKMIEGVNEGGRRGGETGASHLGGCLEDKWRLGLMCDVMKMMMMEEEEVMMLMMADDG